jgi:hypothetical protein
MRRLVRWLFTFSSAASLALSLALGVLWWRGYEGSPSPVWRERALVRGPRLSVGMDRRCVTFGVITPLPTDPKTGRPVSLRGRDWSSAWRVGYMDTEANAADEGARIWPLGHYRGLECHVGYTVALTGLLPLTWTVAALRRRRRNVAGLCPACGYDLRATPERCPECGAAAAVQSQADADRPPNAYRVPEAS